MGVFFYSKVLFFPSFLYCSLWQEEAVHTQLTRQVWSFALPRLKCSIYMHFFVILLQGRLVSSSSFIDLCNHLYQYRVMDIYFIFWITIQYYLVAHTVPNPKCEVLKSHLVSLSHIVVFLFSLGFLCVCSFLGGLFWVLVFFF